MWNKVDLLDEDQRSIFQNMAERVNNVALVSSISGEGCDELLETLDEVLAKDKKTFELTFGHDAGADIALFYQHGEVLERVDSETDCKITVRLDAASIGQLTKMGKLNEG